jgi:hypothetical protein
MLSLPALYAEVLTGPTPDRPSAVDAAPPTQADVLAMAARLPDVECAAPCVGMHRGAFARKRDASEIAQAIADGVAREDEPWRRAAQAVVYAAYEGGMRACPRAGDSGRSHGAWQLWGVAPEVACVPGLALPVWLGIVHASERDCAGLPEPVRLAELASGSCLRGQALVRRRDAIVREVLQ